MPIGGQSKKSKSRRSLEVPQVQAKIYFVIYFADNRSPDAKRGESCLLCLHCPHHAPPFSASKVPGQNAASPIELPKSILKNLVNFSPCCVSILSTPVAPYSHPPNPEIGAA